MQYNGHMICPNRFIGRAYEYFDRNASLNAVLYTMWDGYVKKGL